VTDSLPGRAHEGDYLYVIQFNSGTIKVGRTGNPATRLKNYTTHGRPHGISVTAQWLSQPHRGARKNEGRLIAFCKARYTPLNDGEFFGDADPAEVIAAAERLTTLEPNTDHLRMIRFGRVAGRIGTVPPEGPIVILPIPADLLAAIDADRGRLSRAEWLHDAARRQLGTGASAPAPPAAAGPARHHSGGASASQPAAPVLS
jgi:hypothetical protein